MFIQSEETPNPRAIKFLPDVEVMTEGTAYFTNIEETKISPLARRLFLIEGVVSVFLGSDFIVTQISEKSSWDIMKPKIIAAIMDHFTVGMAVMDESQMPTDLSSYQPKDEVEAKIIELLEERVRPFIEMDGGGLIYHGFENGIVSLELIGSCVGCSSSDVTLKAGIENMLKYYIPEVKEVVNLEHS